MNSKVREDRNQIVDKIMGQIQSGQLCWRQGWRQGRPYNPVSKITYKAGNRLRLMHAQEERGYQDPRWCTFKQAKDNDWSVKRGESAVLCEKWIFTKDVKEIDDKTGKGVAVRQNLKNPYVNYFYVFNAEQISGIPELRKIIKTPNEELRVAESLIQASPCEILEDDRFMGAYYRPSEDKIFLPSRESFESYKRFLEVGLHEMGHATGHESRLNRPISNRFGSPEYAREELVAELCSVFTRADLGLTIDPSGKDFENNGAFLQNWLQVLKEEPDFLFQSTAQAEAASEYILVGYQRYHQLEMVMDPADGHKVYRPLSQQQPNHVPKKALPELMQEKVVSAPNVNSIARDIRQSGFRPTERMVRNIEQLNELTGRDNSLGSISRQFMEGQFEARSLEEQKLLGEIVQECQGQEMDCRQIVLDEVEWEPEP